MRANILFSDFRSFRRSGRGNYACPGAPTRPKEDFRVRGSSRDLLRPFAVGIPSLARRGSTDFVRNIVFARRSLSTARPCTYSPAREVKSGQRCDGHFRGDEPRSDLCDLCCPDARSDPPRPPRTHGRSITDWTGTAGRARGRTRLRFYARTQVLTWSDLDRGANLYARWSGRGRQKGDVVTLLMENCPEYLMAWLGLVKRGVMRRSSTPHLTGQPLTHSLAMAGAKHLIPPPRTARIMPPQRRARILSRATADRGVLSAF